MEKVQELIEAPLSSEELAVRYRALCEDPCYANVPAKTNPLGVKGIGEAGCVGAPPAVMNAILDALRPLGVKHLDMPATPRRVWEALQDAKH